MIEEINLKQSVCTEGPEGSKFYPFGAEEAEHEANTGIERDEGLTNLYEQELAHPEAGSYALTKRGKLLSMVQSGASRNVKIDARTVGRVSTYGVEARRAIAGADDAVVSSQAGYLVTAKLSGQVVTLSNVLIATGAVAASRTITFAALAGLSSFTSLSIVRKAVQQYADVDWEFVVRIGERGLLLRETNPLLADIKYSNTTKYTITAMCAYGTGVAFGTFDGKVFSVDSLGRYRYPDGSGDGTGPYNGGEAMGGARIRAMCADGTMLFVAGETSRVASFDGAAWKWYNGSGSGSGPFSSSVLGTSDINASVVYGNFVVFAGDNGRLGSWDTVAGAWVDYLGAGAGGGPFDNNTVIAANINALATDGATLVVAGNSGRLGNYAAGAWTTYLGGGAGVQPFDNGVVIGASNIWSLCYFGATLVVAGNSGRLGNYAAGAWTTYLGGGAGVEPFTNGAVVGNGTIYSLAVYAGTLLVFGAIGHAYRLGSWDGAAWVDYIGAGAGTGLSKWSLKAFDFGPCGGIAVNGSVFFSGASFAPGSAIYVYNDGLAAWENVHTGAHVPISHLTEAAGLQYRITTYRSADGNAQFLVFSHGSKISSWDGAAWAYWDGAGGGSGPFSNDAVIGANEIYALHQYGEFLVAAGNGGRLGSWDGTAWVDYLGVGAGTGPFDNATVIGANLIYTLCTYSTFLVVAGAGGRVGSWDGAAWKTYLGAGAGTGPFDNATVIGNAAILAICAYRTFLIAAGGTGAASRLGSWDGTAWKTYAGAGAGTGPFSNNAAIIGQDIWALLWWKGFLVLGSRLGASLIASWDGAAWKANDGTGAGTGPWNNGTAAGNVRALGSLSDSLYVFDHVERMASWDGLNWKNADGTGLGTSAFHNTDLSGAEITGVAHWQGGLFHSYSRSVFSVIDKTECARIQAMVVQQFHIPESRLSHLFAYKFEDNSYIVGITGNTESVFYLISATGGTVQPILARYVVMQTAGGFSRALIYGTPTWYDTHLEAVGMVGYTDFLAYTPIVQWPTFGDRIDTVPQAVIGPGSLDMTYTKVAVANQSWSAHHPTFVNPETSMIGTIQSGTDTLIGAYGKLTNTYGLPTAIEVRLLWVGGSPTTLSAAIVDGIEDTLGVLLSGVGEVEEGYAPQIREFGFSNSPTILYRAANGRFVVVVIGIAPSTMIQKVDDRLYKLNTLHPLNLYDDEAEVLALSSVDYNGRALFFNTAAPSVTAKKFAAVIYTPFASGIDAGDKLVYHTVLDAAAYRIIGHRLPSVTSIIPGIGVDVYIEDVYYRTTLNDGSELVDPLKVDTLYLTSTDLPIPIAWVYGDTVAVGEFSTVFLTDGRDVYIIGNEVPGQMAGFQLFGQRYLFDGFSIWLAVFELNAYTRKERVAPGDGLRHIASSPGSIFFLSSGDNSLYAFDGGRSLQKVQRFNALGPILNGVWSTYDNTLALQTADDFIWIRDQIVSVNAKKVGHVSTVFYDTIGGVVIANDTARWRYTYAPLAGSTVYPFRWQSAYFGQMKNARHVLQEFVVKLHSATRQAATVNLSVRQYDEEEDYPQQTEQISLAASDWSAQGFVRLRITPQHPGALASSVGVAFNQKLLLNQVFARFEDAGQAKPQASRSA